MHTQSMPPHITTPFDDSAIMRLRRMGLLMPDGTPDERMIQPLACVSAGLYYDQLCDSVESYESAAGVCRHIISEEAQNRPRQALLALSMSYDAMRRGLPDPIWWLSGSKDIIPIFMHAFAAHLSDILQKNEPSATMEETE